MGQRFAFEAQITIGIVFDNQDAILSGQGHQALAIGERHQGAGGVLEGRRGVDELGVNTTALEVGEHRFEGVDIHTVFEDGDGFDFGAGFLE